MQAADDFTLTAYRALVERFAELRYRIVHYADVGPAERHLILRHDVDMDLGRAVRLAELEAGMGVSASYFVLLRTEMYNLFSAAGQNALQRLVVLGHQVGLHFDAALYPPERADLEAAADRECAVLEGLTGQRVETISFHRPAPALQGLSGLFAGRLHAYDPRFFSDIGYCSDSEGRWRFGHPLAHEAVADGRALQLVTHPIWWCAYGGEEPVAKLNRLIAERGHQLADQIALNCKPFLAHLKARAESM